MRKSQKLMMEDDIGLELALEVSANPDARTNMNNFSFHSRNYLSFIHLASASPAHSVIHSFICDRD